MRDLLQAKAAYVWAGLLLCPAIATAQFPAELSGRVTDALTGHPIESVQIEVLGTQLAALTDGAGEFRFRGLEPGLHTVLLRRIGYLPARRDIELQNGQQARLDLTLTARPVALEEVHAGSDQAAPAGGVVIPRVEIEQGGARNAAEVLEGRSGLVIVRHGPAGAQSVQIRGGSDDEVLVLIDGAPLNSAITGEADLSSIPAQQIESITVLKGSQSARHGPGAEAGVVLIQTRLTAQPARLELGTGSLGEWGGELEGSHSLAGFVWSAGGQVRALNGRFDFSRPAELGGGTATRENADLSERDAFLAGAGRIAGGNARFRAGYDHLVRGLPGLSFQPALYAREDLTRWSGQASLDRMLANMHLSGEAHALEQAARFADPSPPAGLPFDSRTHALTLGGRLTGEIRPGGLMESASGGIEIQNQRYSSTEFTDSAPGGRFDFGLFTAAELVPLRSFSGLGLVTALRLDRDAADRVWRVSHELTGRITIGAIGLYLRQASSYRPPSFGDQFFKEGVAVKPNPDLRAERIPNELAAGLTAQGHLTDGVLARLTVEGFVADVKDLIIWAPDFRFVWSPRNFDAKRRGFDADAELDFPAADLTLRASHSLARVTYDRPGDDTVQVVYRPRHTGAVGAEWRPGRWLLTAQARYTGTRYPVPAPVNALQPFWTVVARVGRDIRVGAWQLTPVLTVDRLLDNEDSLIFGYPEPGRTIRIDITLGSR